MQFGWFIDMIKSTTAGDVQKRLLPNSQTLRGLSLMSLRNKAYSAAPLIFILSTKSGMVLSSNLLLISAVSIACSLLSSRRFCSLQTGCSRLLINQYENGWG
jgi:hypothetical protein